MRRVAPLMSARTDWRFGRKTRLVWLLAWLTLLPDARIFPQSEHSLATVMILLIVPRRVEDSRVHCLFTSLGTGMA